MSGAAPTPAKGRGSVIRQLQVSGRQTRLVRDPRQQARADLFGIMKRETTSGRPGRERVRCVGANLRQTLPGRYAGSCGSAWRMYPPRRTRIPARKDAPYRVQRRNFQVCLAGVQRGGGGEEDDRHRGRPEMFTDMHNMMVRGLVGFDVRPVPAVFAEEPTIKFA